MYGQSRVVRPDPASSSSPARSIGGRKDARKSDRRTCPSAGGAVSSTMTPNDAGSSALAGTGGPTGRPVGGPASPGPAVPGVGGRVKSWNETRSGVRTSGATGSAGRGFGGPAGFACLFAESSTGQSPRSARPLVANHHARTRGGRTAAGVGGSGRGGAGAAPGGSAGAAASRCG